MFIDRFWRRSWSTSPVAQRFMTSGLGARTAVAFLISIMAVRLFASLGSTGMVTDEFAHIPAGYSYVKEQRFEINAEHPPLVKYLAGLPLLFLNPPLPKGDPLVKGFAWSSQFLYGAGGQARQVITWARAPMILLGCLLGFMIYIWASELFGRAGGLFSLLLFVFEPNILAHSRFVLTDISASLVYLTFWYFGWRWVKVPSLWNSLLLSGLAGLALLVKHSMVILPFCWALMVVLMMAQRRLTVRRGLQDIILGTAVIVLVLNAGYGFQSKFFDSADLKMVAGWFGWKMEAAPINGSIRRVALLPVPSAYISGLDNVVNHGRDGHPAYLLGQYSTRGWWYYFPVAFLLKVPLALLLVFALSSGWLIWFARRNTTDALCLLGPLLVYGTVAMTSHLNIGIRHVLPLYPFFFVAAGGLFEMVWRRRSRFRWVLVGLACWLIGASLRMSYDPVEYFNEVAGGPQNGWRYLADSNLDFGQSFVSLMKFLEDNKLSDVNLYVVGVEYNLAGAIRYNCVLPYSLPEGFRSTFPYTFHETYEAMRPGVYAISIAKIIDPFVFTSTNIEDRARGFALRRLLALEPKAKIGNMVSIYDLKTEDIARAGLSNAKLYYYNGMKFNPPD